MLHKSGLFMVGKLSFIALLLVVFMVGCGKETVNTTDTTPPFVTSTSPAPGATGLALNPAISATFSEAMNGGTINSASFVVTDAAGPVAGAVALAGNVATFTPTTALAAQDTVYTATVANSVKDLAGNAMANAYIWTFETIEVPQVVAVTPPAGTTGVALNQSVSATFLQDPDSPKAALNCATLTSATFTLAAASGPVTAAVTCAGATATLTPSQALAPNTIYTALLSRGVQNAAGSGLTAPNAWTFRTAPASATPQVIAVAPLNNATAVPTNQKLAATFSEAMDPATINGSTVTLAGPGGVAVPGAVSYSVAGATATFAPTANLAALTTYVATINTGAKDLSGRALAGNYAWTFTTGTAPDVTKPTVISTIPANNATAVPINQAVSATFSKAMDPATITPLTFTLTGPGTTAVSAFVTYAAVGNTATLTPASALKPSTVYTATMATGAADLAGNALASSYVWSFTTAASTDTTAPTVISTNPANAAAAVPTTASVNATFSKAMDPLTITTATLQLAGPGGAVVNGTVVYDPVNFIATFTPTAALTPATTYTATVTNGAADLSGNALGAGIAPNPWSFTTGAAPAPAAVDLGTAATFGDFGGGAGMTNSGVSSVVNGNIGTTGVSTLITGFHDDTVMVAGLPQCIYTETPLATGLVNGTIDTAPPPPTVSCPTEGTAATATIANKAAADALTAFNALVAFPGGLDVSTCAGCGGGGAGELGNRTLAPGIYKSAPGSYSISNGDLTLDAQGNPNAFWVFQMATSLTVGTPSAPRNVILINGAQAKNVFWQVGSAATINGILGGGTMVGTIIAQSGVSISTVGVATITTLNGRALALTGPVTIVNTVINVPAP